MDASDENNGVDDEVQKENEFSEDFTEDIERYEIECEKLMNSGINFNKLAINSSLKCNKR